MSVASVTDPIFVPTIDHEREGFIRCGTLGHAWHDYDTVGWTTTMGVPLTLRCERCGTERRDVIGAYGQLVTRHYAYPQGYKYPRGQKRPDRSQFRIMLLTKRIQESRNTRSK